MIGIISAHAVGGTTYSTEVLLDTPRVYWRLTESAGPYADSGALSKAGSSTGTAPTLVSGPVGSAQQWTTSTGGIHNITNPFSYSTATVEAWVKFAANPAAQTTIVGHAQDGIGSSTHDKDLYVRTDGKVAWYCFDGTQRHLLTPSALSFNVWHHLMATIGAAGQIIYLDGSQVSIDGAVTTSFTGAPQSPTVRGGGTGSGGMNGSGAMLIAEPAFYNTQLSSTRALAHYSAPPG